MAEGFILEIPKKIRQPVALAHSSLVGAFGDTRGAIEAVFRGCSVGDAQKIVGGNALALFRMDGP